MKKLFWLAVVITVMAAFFASANPDGLDFVAGKFGFAVKGQERTAPLSGYSLNLLPTGGMATAFAGIAGILITLSIFWLTAVVLTNRKKGMKAQSHEVGATP